MCTTRDAGRYWASFTQMYTHFHTFDLRRNFSCAPQAQPQSETLPVAISPHLVSNVRDNLSLLTSIRRVSESFERKMKRNVNEKTIIIILTLRNERKSG